MMEQSDGSAARPLTKGQRTRARIMEAAEEVLGKRGYHDASIAEITRLAGVAQGSFYIYFESKQAIFEELIRIRGREMRDAVRRSFIGVEDRDEFERAGFRTFFDWVRKHRWLFRVVHAAEFVDPALREEWYRTFSDEYTERLSRRMDADEVPKTEPEVLAWCIMGLVDFTALRWIVWSETEHDEFTDDRFEMFFEIAQRALRGQPPV